MIFEVNRRLIDWGYTRMSAGSPMFSILSNYSELDIDWLLRRLGFVDKSVVKRSIQYIEVYWLDGFSSSFFIALDGFLNYIYSRVGKGLCDINTFKGDVRGIIESSLIEGVYDIVMSKFFTYIYSLAIKWIRGERRRSAVERPIGLYNLSYGLSLDYRGEHRRNNVGRHRGDYIEESAEFRRHRDLFFTRCEDLGISIDRELFASNLVGNRVTPLVFSFLWLLRLGELSNAEG